MKLKNKYIIEVSMRKYLLLILTLIPLYGMASNFDLPVVRSLKNGKQCEISFNDKVVSKHDCEFEYPSFLISYSLLPDSWTGVWIFQDAPMGNACEAGAIRVFSIDSKNKVTTHSPMDYCSGTVVVNNDSAKVEMYIRDSMNAKKIESWVFEGDKLVKR